MEEKPRKNYLIANDEFDLAFANYFFGDNQAPNKFLNEKHYRLESDSISYRILNHWENEGLLSSERPGGTGWRKYSVNDLVWVRIIHRLRGFGYSLKMIHKVKENLAPKSGDKSPFPFLEFHIAYAMVKVPGFLAVFDNGEAIPCSLGQFETAKYLGSFGDCILISINDILQEIFPKKNLSPNWKISMELNDDELELLITIRLKEWSEVKIKGKDGKIEMIERTESIDNETRIVDILTKGDYQNIEVIQENKKIVSIKRTEKNKLK